MGQFAPKTEKNSYFCQAHTQQCERMLTTMTMNKAKITTAAAFAKMVAVVLCVAATVAGCTSDHFTIEGTLADAGTQNVRIVFATDDGFDTEWVTMKDGRFTYTGSSVEPVVVYVFNQQKKLIVHALVQNGDDIEFEGTLAAPYATRVRGTDANEEWSDFIVKHGDDFANSNFSATDAAIAEFIAANPSNVVSTLLLMCDYSDLTDKKKVDGLLSKIEIESRPESVMRTFYAMQSMRTELTASDRMSVMTLWSDRDSMEFIRPYYNTMSIYYFWNPDDKSRKNDFSILKDFGKELDSKRLQIVDIDLDSDTLRWKSIVRSDSASWRRFWAVGGVTNTYLNKLSLGATPYYILTDSTGRMLYHGGSFAPARKLIEGKLKK